VVTDAAEGRTIVEYRVTSTSVDQNLFIIPADYQIMTQVELAHRWASKGVSDATRELLRQLLFVVRCPGMCYTVSSRMYERMRRIL